MASNRKLKVFRTSIGFHDAYVAAPSRKAALAAWGATTDLFAIGSAEQVTEPELMATALARPGEVIRRSRGSTLEHLKAAGRIKPAKPSTRRSNTKDRPRNALSAPPERVPRPGRKRLETAEKALEEFDAQARAQLDAVRRREADLSRERAAIETRLEKSRARAEQRVDRARSDYENAMARWRDS